MALENIHNHSESLVTEKNISNNSLKDSINTEKEYGIISELFNNELKQLNDKNNLLFNYLASNTIALNLIARVEHLAYNKDKFESGSRNLNSASILLNKKNHCIGSYENCEYYLCSLARLAYSMNIYDFQKELLDFITVNTDNEE